ncbi:hypothetical protein Aab01nite_41260 [Paractinoplanes abujensis]|uniref:LPXTG-motif cell wall-anchored protein n=1 Tax=Paractinoplanes abujensis TaxID=882441 RepID=A0A7W7CWE0_9ACTN|nr:LPXTG cell wall anchor domain-containing protein [Actinoplanes abujensis]MBB4694251.1 LPXTG-motif cell wall-anchored protein [Actinoplanes abujensis]GID20536.1 hypothetical protein Aab01nite_41260 [Actinoplanes abujensis]
MDWLDPARELRLQARAGANAPWRTVATTKSRADGTYAFTTPFAGTSDYRVIAPPVAWVPNEEALAYAETPATTVRGAAGGGGQGGGGGLPVTGASVTPIAIAGGLLVLLGVLFATLGRRRRDS